MNIALISEHASPLAAPGGANANFFMSGLALVVTSFHTMPLDALVIGFFPLEKRT